MDGKNKSADCVTAELLRSWASLLFINISSIIHPEQVLTAEPRCLSHLVSTFESRLCSFASFLHRLHEDAESSLAAALHAEVQRRLPGRLLQRDLPPLRLGCTCDVQQTQMALHFLTGEGKMGEWWAQRCVALEMRWCGKSIKLLSNNHVMTESWGANVGAEYTEQKPKYRLMSELTVASRCFSNSSRKRVMAWSPSKSLKWLLTHSNTILVTCFFDTVRTWSHVHTVSETIPHLSAPHTLLIIWGWSTLFTRWEHFRGDSYVVEG